MLLCLRSYKRDSIFSLFDRFIMSGVGECGGKCQEAHMAAEFGKNLLEENQQLRAQMETLQTEIDNKQEVLNLVCQS